MVLISIDDLKNCCRNQLNSFDIVYLSGKILVINPMYYRRKMIHSRCSIIRKLVEKYQVVMYANYIFSKSKHRLYGVQPDHLSLDLWYDHCVPLTKAKIVLASSITRIRSLDELISNKIYLLKPTVKALLDLKKSINGVIVVRRIKPQYAVVIAVEKFGPLLNLNDISFCGIKLPL